MTALAGRFASRVSVGRVEQLSFAEFIRVRSREDGQRRLVMAAEDMLANLPTGLVFVVDELDDDEVEAIYAAVTGFECCDLQVRLASESVALPDRVDVIVFEVSAAQRLAAGRWPLAVGRWPTVSSSWRRSLGLPHSCRDGCSRACISA